MINRLSLRFKITFVVTIIIILISTILTITSVHNANIIFLPTVNSINLKDNNEPTYKLGDKPINDSINEEVRYKESINMSRLSYNFKYNAVLYMIIIIFVGSILIYFILGKMLNPVKKFSKQIEIINEYQLSDRVSGFNSCEELGELQKSFNSMLDRLDRAFESKKRFSSDAAHELKTPLAVLKNSLDVLEIDENPSEEDYKYTVAIFKKQTERMISLVNNLFTMSEQKDYHFNDTVDMNIIINDIIKDLAKEIEDKSLSINTYGKSLSVKGNSVMLNHAISNIIQNAVKYNNKNGSIDIITEEVDKKCIITIKDTGVGIEKGKEKEIFEPFYRVDTSRSRKIGGAGLGLAITKDIISRHGGGVSYTPNESGGSIFEITLPMIKI